MSNDRRQILFGAMGVGAGALGASAVAAAASAGKGVTLDAELVTKIRQDLAARECDYLMHRYEGLLSAAHLEEALDLFALKQPDVQADVGFGFFYGAASCRRLFVGMHGWLERQPGTKNMKNGALYLVANTTGIVEVAQDLKTAKGHWLCPTISTPGNEKDGFHAITGYAHRVADFIVEDGKWKIWHYMVYGLLYNPADKVWTDAAVYNEVAKPQDLSWIPKEFQPDAPSAPGIGREYAWRPDRPPTTVRLPEPYRTFSETFSYARKWPA